MANSASQERNVCSKHRKSSNEETCFDRISQLPDVLIQHILSFLPTKDAVATTVLSKRWFWLWTSVPLIDLKDSPSCITSKSRRIDFIQFVTQVLIFNGVSCLDKFCLKLHGVYLPSFVNNWIQNAVARDLRELDITISAISTDSLSLFKLPYDIFTSKTLNILKLSYDFELDVPGTISLPRLKVLHLVWVKYRDDESISRLLDGCPVLQELLVQKHDDDSYNAQTLKISIPTLKSLSLTLWLHGACKVKINAPVLQYLYLKENLNCSIIEYDIDNLSSLVEANVTFSDLGVRNIRLIKALCNVKFLSFGWDKYAKPPDRRCFKTFPLHLNLVRLELNIGCCGWTSLSYFLESSDNLEVLVLNKKPQAKYRWEWFGLWEPPRDFPKCFLSSVKKVYFRGFEGLQRGQMEVVKYILENAHVLKMMNISTNSDSNPSLGSKFAVLKKLVSMFPRGSKACQLQFS